MKGKCKYCTEFNKLETSAKQLRQLQVVALNELMRVNRMQIALEECQKKLFEICSSAYKSDGFDFPMAMLGDD